MQAAGAGASVLFLGSILAVSAPLLLSPAAASTATTHQGDVLTAGAYLITPHRSFIPYSAVKGEQAAHYSGISCVPFARVRSGIQVIGNAWQWWNNAAGKYARGKVPEAGSVLAFKANGQMRLGHVAVVSRVINPREVAIDHANWAGSGTGAVARNIPVVDVSDANDWSAVRVGMGKAGKFGSVYPTYGFIYDRPDTGAVLASVSPAAPQPALNPAPRDLRPAAERPWQMYEEIAEEPAAKRKFVVSHNR